MRVLVADVLGMCFGVRDALRSLETIADPSGVTIHGELVHNEVVLERLRNRGFAMLEESRRVQLPLTETVLITAHGISNRERERLLQAGKSILDTTCPLVTRAHDAALGLQREGYHVLLIGRPNHVEVQGIVEDLASFDVIAKPDEVKRYAHPRLGILCQTTTPARLARAIRDAVARLNSEAEIRFIDTVCHPTKEHQQALEGLLEQVEAMVVVGGRYSNNTLELVARCRESGMPTYHVQAADDLQPSWFDGIHTLGLTAGTSTLAETIAEVRHALESLAGKS